ncbi:thiamine phosphate synthase [Amorphoplanes digitatis]|uniref:Thiamine-phosphate synthase n=1 Tax=Actinoplanes digitatis TaxID=1868 RepID=A0A7W7MU87_9ACTN|nr:thiamine phosphate synthase [Actinoplanes digitatis]MBB4766520.1 thiamine-phosphate pyrophosphorylase [Actinoplanes digitatis]GID98115.1 thiamine-phosphate synthase [Actinoplanes digitatis]
MGPDFPHLHLITDARRGREPLSVVAATVAEAHRRDATGRLAVQIRVEDDVSDRETYELADAVLEICRPYGVLCLVNDRLHVALAVGADGGHVGAGDLPVAAARRVLGPAGVLGATCRDAAAARAARRAGASYLGVGPAFATTTKAGLPDPLGPAVIGEVAAAVPDTPIVAIGGVTAANAGSLIAAGAAAVAVVGAIANAADPGRAAGEMLAALA